MSGADPEVSNVTEKSSPNAASASAANAAADAALTSGADVFTGFTFAQIPFENSALAFVAFSSDVRPAFKARALFRYPIAISYKDPIFDAPTAGAASVFADPITKSSNISAMKI